MPDFAVVYKKGAARFSVNHGVGQFERVVTGVSPSVFPPKTFFCVFFTVVGLCVFDCSCSIWCKVGESLGPAGAF